VDDVRNYPYRIRCAKFVRILKPLKSAESPAIRGPEPWITTAAGKPADSDYPVKG
jgi:hypothetical protein